MGSNLRREVEVDDLCQLVVTSLLESSLVAEFDAAAPLQAYLRRTVLHRVQGLVEYHHRAKRDRSRELPLEEALDRLAVEDTVVRTIEARELEVLVRRSMSQLAPEERAVVSLVFLAGLQPAEASRALQVADSTLRSRLARGLARLAYDLGDYRPEGTL